MVILDKLVFKFFDLLFDAFFSSKEQELKKQKLTTENKKTDAKKEILKEIKKWNLKNHKEQRIFWKE